MKMIPDHLLHSKSSAEKRVFKELQAVSLGGKWYAFHSLNLPRHETKRFGEVDFVVCGPGGLFTFEVKGGRISCENGKWGTKDADDRYFPLGEPPIVQAEGALHGLQRKIDKRVLRSFVCGYGVITPDCSMEGIESAEWDKRVWADSRKFRDFEKWLRDLVKHWHEVASRQYRPSDASADEVEALAKILRPDFDTATPLFDRIALAEDSIATMTEEQLRAIDFIGANPRVICGGGAGTGKTFLAVELAKRWASSGRTVALTCFSPWLKRYIENCSLPGVTVSLFNGLEVAARRSGIDKFDAIIVDEGQDLLSFSSLDRLGTLIHGGLEKGRWCFFHDINNQAGVLGHYDPDALAYLKDLGASIFPLQRNCRNTSQILEKIQSSLNVDMGNASVGKGPDIKEIKVTPSLSTAEILKREIREILHDSDFTVGDIVILSPRKFRESGAYPLRSDPKFKVSELDSFSTGCARREVGFAAIADYKGLESEAVFVIDMPEPGLKDKLRSLHYIGMSRARVLLYLVIDAFADQEIDEPLPLGSAD